MRSAALLVAAVIHLLPLQGVLGSDRLEYWKLNAPGGESYLSRLGLKPRPLRMP